MRFQQWCVRLLAVILAASLTASMIRPASTLENQTEPLDLAETVTSPLETEASNEATESIPQPTEETETATETAPLTTETVPCATDEAIPEMTIPPTELSPLPEMVTQPQEIMQILTMAETLPVEEATEQADAGARDDDLNVVSGHGITFKLFNYSTNINKSAGNTTWRPISSYFAFRNSLVEYGADAAVFQTPAPSTNEAHDQDGFTASHATVERILTNGLPVLDLTRNADGTFRADPGISSAVRSLAYLFSPGDHAVTAYSPRNTILQRSGSRYYYNSASHAVDYDEDANLFRLRSYTERNSTTASYDASYGDFLPFTYTGGIVAGTTEDGADYHVLNQNTDYWFGMTMTVNFFQTKNGKLGDQDMVFNFSGDDDVWVFVDDVLVLDLGGTHGTVDGSINFATGEVRQYLSWRGANTTETARAEGSATSFPTTIRACFDAAAREPWGGWSADGQTFADFTEHTLKFFYLERGAAVANCMLDFRLPTLPDESLTVTKDLTADSDETVREFIADSLDYSFRVMKADTEGNATEEFFLPAGTAYDLLESGNKIGTGTVGDGGIFRLKAGQSAQFTQMLQKGGGATAYVVEEIMPDALVGQYAGVEYLVSGAGGNTVTEHDEAQDFTAFCSGCLSAEQTQTVTFRNRVDTSKLCALAVTKQAAPGTVIAPDEIFKIQVMLGGNLLPVGTPYTVDGISHNVETAGILQLRAGETAVLSHGILSGTVYEVAEVDQDSRYRPSYEGTIQPSGEMVVSADGVTGSFPLASAVHVTVTNADYDFAVEIPIEKRVHEFRESGTFYFLVQQVEFDNGWHLLQELPAQQITVTDAHGSAVSAVIGYDSGTEGIFYYRISEQPTGGAYIDDDSFYIVEVTAAEDAASVTAILKNGHMESDNVSFVNHATARLTVTKTVTGMNGDMKFPFTATVYLDGEAFVLPQPEADAAYSVDGNRITFSLGHGDAVTITHLPVGSLISIEEENSEGFQVFSRIGTEQISGSSTEVVLPSDGVSVEFINQSGFRLPNTGGMGADVYTAGGALLCAAVMYRQYVRRKEENATS